ncbi:uncharacterized protein LOC122850363 [Aphidius gifuensis]|uniref:uncharacterized protein LOC122850363 n=1 Tax=Aphidius gifuensis TaxID=684658 RepID=UPI001CDC89A9|nr:uncharacterized protein LOC122850363 [Aphidius gifuensis]
MLSLTENMRTLPEEKEFSKYLLNVGNGVLNDKNDNIIAPEQCIAENNEDIVESIFKEIIKNQKYDELTKVAVLAARNVDVDEINYAILPEYLHSLNPSNFPQHELKLRINCVVMLLRNLSIAEGLCNRTRLQILELAHNLLKYISNNNLNEYDKIIKPNGKLKRSMNDQSQTRNMSSKKLKMSTSKSSESINDDESDDSSLEENFHENNKCSQ